MSVFAALFWGREMVLSDVEELITESEKVYVLESSMHSLAISEKHDDELEAANDLQNSVIEMEEAVCWEDDDSHEDYVPFLYLRSTGTSRAEIDKLPEIRIDEAVLDVEEVPIVPEEDQPVPVEHKVETVKDLIGKKASICYNDNLLSLARCCGMVYYIMYAMNTHGFCEHEPLDDSSSAAHQTLTAIVLNKRWLKDVKKYITFSYRRYYNKKSKNWSVHVTKEAKMYAYIPDLQKAILRRRLESGSGLPRRRTLSEDDPERLGLVGTADTPPPTAELVARHISRGAMALVMED
ncbi:unnamed protein product [Leuciscus chuanchicus]